MKKLIDTGALGEVVNIQVGRTGWLAKLMTAHRADWESALCPFIRAGQLASRGRFVVRFDDKMLPVSRGF